MGHVGGVGYSVMSSGGVDMSLHFTRGLTAAYVPDVAELAMGYTIAFVIYFSLHFLSSRVFGSDMLQGSPRFNWILCALGQVSARARVCACFCSLCV